MAIKKPFVVKESQPIKSAHDFTLKRDEWEQAVLDNATSFSVVIFYKGWRYRKDFTVLQEAIEEAMELEEMRPLVYAITENGRSVVLPAERWNELTAKERYEDG